ncbi:ABC transporter permease [Paenibacillus harenae]|uniref:ABC transporter permease n=1 Tax=Paenibacillus harenae TaxID=306543 RepID=UPI000405C7ED|nr:ABC transporter permease [Paenibacillus harenae]
MRIWLTTAYYELVKYSRMRSVLIILIGLPLLLILLLGSAFDTEIKPAKLALYVGDQGELSASVNEFWIDDSIASYIKVIKADSEREVQDFVQEGTADYGVYVPADFSKRVMAGEKAEWQTFSGRYAEKNIAADAVVNSYMANINLQLAATAALGSGAAVQSAGPRDEPPLMIGTLGNPEDRLFGETSAMQYYAAAYLIMFLLYSGMSAALALLQQKEDGTLQRMYALPVSFRTVVSGILTGAVFLAALQSIVIITFTKYVYHVQWSSQFLWIALICLLTTASGVGLAIIVASIAGSAKSTQTLFSILVFTMTFVSGGMMAGIQDRIGITGKLSVNHWANESLRALMSGSDFSAVSHEIGILAVIASVLFMIAMMRLPKVVKKHA